MAESVKYTVDINIDPYWVDIFNKSDTKLIMAKVFVDSGKDVFNIVASTSSTSAIYTFRDYNLLTRTSGD
ncbi:hypothetical protein MAN_09219, partial [Metarhizium hybridum]